MEEVGDVAEEEAVDAVEEEILIEMTMILENLEGVIEEPEEANEEEAGHGNPLPC